MGEENKTKQVRVKIVHKHETEEHWNVSNYIPEIGEVVFYDPDSLHNYTRQKNGDGVHVVKDLPFAVDEFNSDTTYKLSASKNMANGNVTLDLAAGGAGSGTDSVTIRGAGAVEVTTDNDGIITVYSSTTEAAGASLGLVKTGGDVTISEGIISINDDSHNHTIDNIKGLQAALDDKAQADHSHDYILISQKGNANGVAELDSEGKVPNTQLPSNVNNVVEGYYNSSDKLFYKEDYYITPVVGELEKIYIDILTNKIYRWGGDASKFIIVSETVEVGTTTGTALDGKIGNDHIMSLANPHNVTKEQVGLSRVENERQYSQNNPPPYPVVSVAGKTGEVALNASDVGLGYVENKSSATIRSELTKDDITNALGYTPVENAGIANIEVTGSGNAITTAEYNKTNRILTLTKGATYNNYTHPRHTEKDSGIYKITVDNQGHVSEAEAIKKADIVALGIPEKDTTYEVVSTGAAGLAPALPTSDATTKYLRGDGTWQEVTSGQMNQNAFSKIAVGGQLTVEADQATDTLNLANGDNISITTDATNDRVVIGVATNPIFNTVYASTIAPKNGDKIYLAGDLAFSYDDYGTESSLLETHEIAQQAQEAVQDLDDSLAQVAKTGSYSDLSNKPTIPSLDGYATEEYVEDKYDELQGQIPTSLKNPNAITIQAEGTTLTNGVYDGSVAKTVNITKSSLGLGNVENKNSATIRSELTKENVVNALKYTPPISDTTYSMICEGDQELEVSFGIKDSSNNVSTITIAGNAGIDVYTDGGGAIMIEPSNALLKSSQLGAANGIASLGSDGKVPSSQLPSYVDDVVEYSSTSAFPTTGQSGKIYVDTSTNKTYRWGGSAYVEISASLALGETSSTAYYGDKGKIAYDHSQSPHAPVDAQKNVQSDWTATSGDAFIKNKPSLATVATSGAYSDLTGKPTVDTTLSSTSTNAVQNKAIKAALDEKVDTVSGKGLSTNDYTDAEKTKLAGIAENANNYSHPTHTAKSSGLYKVTVDGLGHVTGATAVAKADITNLGIPAQDTTYSIATKDKEGLMPKLQQQTGYVLDGYGNWTKITSILPGLHADDNTGGGTSLKLSEDNYIDIYGEGGIQVNSGTESDPEIFIKLNTATSDSFGGVKIGSNITNNNGTISVTKTNVTNALGYTPPETDENTTYTFATGDNNGTIKVTPSGGSAQNVAVKGLGSAAYTASTAYLASSTKYAGSSAAGGAATSALKLSDTSKIGDTNKPVYFTDGIPKEIGYTIATDVPANAVFTDTKYGVICGPNQTGTVYFGIKNYNTNGTELIEISGNKGIDVYTDETGVLWVEDTRSFASVATSGSYNDLTNKPSKVSAFENDKGYLTSYTETDPTVPAWAKASAKPSYNLGEISDTSSYVRMTPAERTKLSNIAAGAEVNVQSDWNQTTTTADDYIKNKPTLGSLASKSTVSKTDLDSSVQTSLGKADSALQSYTETDPTVPSHVKGITTTDISNWNAKSNFSGSYTDLTDKPTIPTVNNATLTIQKNGTTVKTFTANSATNVTANITVPTTASDIGAVPTSRKVNGQALSTDITIDIPEALADLSSDATHRTVTDTEKATWNAKSNFSGSYNDLTNKPTIIDTKYTLGWDEGVSIENSASIILRDTINNGSTSFDLIGDDTMTISSTEDGILFGVNKTGLIVSKEAAGLAPQLPTTNADSSFLNGKGEWKTIGFWADNADLDEFLEDPHLRFSVGSTSTVYQTRLIGSTGIKVEADDVGEIYFSGVAAGGSLGLVKSGGDVTISNGVITVNDDSHNHVISNIDGLQGALDSKIPTSQKGAASGVATLGSDGKVPTSQLPSYVDDVLEYSAKTSFPTTGESGKIYVDLATNKTYRWSGSAYVEISASIVIGTTTGTALDGKVGNDHIANTGNPHGVTKTQVGLGNVDNVKQYSASNPPPYPVTSVAGKTGAVTLAKADVGLGNVENKSSATILSELTKTNVTTALGYTPLDENDAYSHPTTHPASMITGLATVATSGSYNDLTNKPTIPTKSSWNYDDAYVKYSASQSLTDTQKSTARANIGAGTSSFSGSYNDLTNKPTIPTVNNGTLTIQKNGTNVATFTANQSGNSTANITVPTKVSELTNDSGFKTTDTNTTYDLAASKSSANGNVNIQLTAGGSGSGTDSVAIKGSGATTVTTDANGVITINSTDNNTTYDVVSTSANGLAPKLAGGTTKYLRADGTWAVPPDNNTTYSVATTTAAGLMPQLSNNENDFLNGKGVWVTVNNAEEATF